MTELAAVILAHTDPAHLRRLIAALPDIPIVVHCDAKTSPVVFGAMTGGLPSRVTTCPRISTSLASWSLVEAELQALRDLLHRSSAEHIIVASGSDYPLTSMSELSRTLDNWRGRSHFWNVPLPYEKWSTPRNPDGGLWRFSHRFITRHHNIVYLRDIPLRWPYTRRIPAHLELRAGSQWKIYARHHAELLLHSVDHHPDLIRFWRNTLVPDESFAASVLSSPAFAGSERLTPSQVNAWHMHWAGGNSPHPSWFTLNDFDELARASKGAHPDNPGTSRTLFARKFSTAIDQQILDRIDAELRTTR